GTVPSTRTISTTAPLTGGGDLSANRTLGITQATTSTDGYLSSTDWDIFNNKLDNITGLVNPGTNVTITGTGTGGDPYVINSSGGGSGAGYKIDQTPDNGTYGLISGTVDGVNATFTVSMGSYISGTLMVWLNGLVQLQG